MRNNLREMQDRALKECGAPVCVAVALDKWASWMHGGQVTRGYPSKACGMESGGIRCSEDGEAEADNYAALACDGVIRGLSVDHRNAVAILWLGTNSYVPDMHTVTAEALFTIHRGLILRGVC